MKINHDYISLNREHFDKVYSKINIDEIINKLQNLSEFLDDATKTDTSWHGIYLDGFADRIIGKRIFEHGCGYGLNALIMASLGAQVIANDISTESERIIKEVASRLKITNIDPLSGDFADLPFRHRSFDFVVGKMVLHHLTHNIEEMYLSKFSKILKPDGEARFVEPSANSPLLDKLRLLVPKKNRPSIINKRAFAEWKAKDHNPDRNNSSNHFFQIGKRFFDKIQIIPVGSIEWFYRLMPQGSFNRRYRRWAHRMETKLPLTFRQKAAPSQLIVYSHPKNF